VPINHSYRSIGQSTIVSKHQLPRFKAAEHDFPQVSHRTLLLHRILNPTATLLSSFHSSSPFPRRPQQQPQPHASAKSTVSWPASPKPVPSTVPHHKTVSGTARQLAQRARSTTIASTVRSRIYVINPRGWKFIRVLHVIRVSAEWLV
jgi:hypothetical protein